MGTFTSIEIEKEIGKDIWLSLVLVPSETERERKRKRKRRERA